MLKLISSNDFLDEPSVSIINPTSVGGLVKTAADQSIKDFVSTIVPDPDKIYVHILAMGAGEYYGANRNADYFPEANLKQYFKTFETSPAHIFRNHVNKDPKIAIGKVVYAVYNERMHRVEVIAWIDKNKGADIIERVERGEFPPTSMACKTPFDVCSICGNKAHTREEYCEHLSHELNRMYPDGRKVMALNLAPLHFFDMSIVFRPADVTSAVLQKVASAEVVIGSAEAAENEGLVEKAASLKKLSELIKELDDGLVVEATPTLSHLLEKVNDPPRDIIPTLASHRLADVLSTMAGLGISPSIKYLSELIGYKISGEHVDGVGDLVQGCIEALGPEALLEAGGPIPKGGIYQPTLGSVLTPFIKSASLVPEMVMYRASPLPLMHQGQVVPTGEVGYMHNGPIINFSPKEQFEALQKTKNQGSLLSFLKTLFTIGGAAIAAKWYITSEIDKRVKELEQKQSGQTKIVLVKSASDGDSTLLLAKADLYRSLYLQGNK